MTDDEAQAMLKQLSAHFHEPVMPVTRYCDALNAWCTCHQERATRLRNELFPDMQLPYAEQAAKDACDLYMKERKVTDRLSPIYRRGEKPTKRDYDLDEMVRFEHAAESINHVFLQIRKSCLLARTLYGGEQIRTVMCPEHKGHWSGIEHDQNYCTHGCQFTGWLPEPANKPPYPPGVFQWTTPHEDGTVTRELRKDGKPWSPPEEPKPDQAGPVHHAFIAIDPNPLERK